MKDPLNQSLNDQLQNKQLPPSLDGQLRAFRHRLRIVKLIEVAFAALTGFLIAYFLVFTIERFTALSPWVRAAILLVGTVGFSVLLPIALRRWFWNTRQLKQVAKYLRKTFPVLGDEILSVIEMNSHQTGYGASPRLVAAATEQTCDRVDKHDLDQAAPAGKAKKRVILAGAAAGVMAALMLVVPSAAGNSWLRFLNPWTSTPRFTFAKLTPLSGEQIVPYGESFPLVVGLDQTSQWKPTTGIAKIGPATIVADNENDAYHFSLPAQTDSSTVGVTVGDDSCSVKLKPMTRPELSTITARTTLPEYLQYSQPLEQTSSTRRFRSVVGSSMTFVLNANRELKSATLDDQPLDIDGQYVSTGPIRVDADAEHSVNWRDIYSLQPRRPIELEINAVKDQAPSIVFEQFDDRVLLLDKSIRFNFTGRDDFGILKIGIEWVGQPKNAAQPIRGEKLLFAGNPQQRSVGEKGIFTPALENVVPQVLNMRLFVEDYLPGRGRVYSRPQTLQIMSHEDHVAWINEKMQAWKSKADAIYEREVALAEENLELRRLTPEALQKPENIRRMENQAAAEKDNSQRLDRAVDQGEDLIEQALANDNLRAEQVAKWAASLEQLRKIARQDIPGIADQLDRVNEANKAASASESPQQSSENSKQTTNDKQSGDSESEKNNPSEEKSGDKKSGENESNKQDDDDHDDPDSETEPDSSSPKTVGEDRLDIEPQQQPDSGDGESSESKPQLRDVESSMLPQDSEDSDSDTNAGSENSADGSDNDGGNLDLPTTDLLNPQLDPEQQEEQLANEQPDEAPPEPSLDGVVEDQQKLLEEFEKVREAMDEVMGEFENSTFVKRFKSAARTQLELAGRLNRLVGDRFGAFKSATEIADDLASLSDAHQNVSSDMRKLKTDLEAYQSREPEDSRQSIIDEMNSLKMLVKLEELPLRLQKNRLGDTLHRSEFWADAFDRWAEELVPPARPGGGDGDGEGGQQKSLPPAIVLEVLRQTEDEMNLRDETRSFNLSRKAMSSDEQQQRNDGLTVYQMAVLERSLDTIDDVKQLPGGEQDFGETIDKLRKAAESMDEASGMLFDSTTDAPVVAAESAAIEALLASRRVSPRPSNSNPDEDNSGLDGSESLADSVSPMSRLKPGGLAPQIQPRDVGAGTSASVAEVPERYRDGIDSFTHRLGLLRKNISRNGESK